MRRRPREARVAIPPPKNRRQQVVEMSMAGFSDRDVAETFGIKPVTVRFYRMEARRLAELGPRIKIERGAKRRKQEKDDGNS